MTEKEFYEMIRDRIRDYLPERYENCRVELNEVVKIGHFEFRIIKNTQTKIELVKLKVIE